VNPPSRFAVLTISDRCSRAQAQDTAGPAIISLIEQRLAGTLATTRCIPDDPQQIEETLRAWSAPDQKIDLLLTTGGTGLGPRDNTPEAAARVIQRPHPALMELARLRCSATSPRAYLSRGVAGAANNTLIITLPGSAAGATETLTAILDLLPHAIEMIRGGTH
jgi:molybdenum cofactor synthesis domain-containing protein